MLSNKKSIKYTWLLFLSIRMPVRLMVILSRTLTIATDLSMHAYMFKSVTYSKLYVTETTDNRNSTIYSFNINSNFYTHSYRTIFDLINLELKK